MLLERLYDTPLAQASYLIGCQATGEAIVVDPNRDTEQYLRVAAHAGLRITQVTETHIHADFASGARELAQRAGAQLLLSGEGGKDWQYAYASDAGARLLHDGDTIAVGNVRLDVMHTPGHTPEHLTFLVTDTPASERPLGAFTGDFIFVGDVGRPDLLERAAGQADTMAASARTLWQSLQRFARLPDYLQLWPGHGAGSACGKSLGAVPSSTLGYEKLANWAFAMASEDAFVREVLDGQPEPPRYFASMKRLNREGPSPLGERVAPPQLRNDALEAALREGLVVVDLRRTAEFAGGYVPGTLNLPFGESFVGWAGSFIPYDRDIQLIAESSERAVDAARALAMIGLDRVTGWYEPSVFAAWRARWRTLDIVPQLTPNELVERRAEQPRELRIFDVRSRAEWEAGHIPGVANVPLASLPELTQGLDRDTPIVLHCQGGGRSSVAASLLRAQGFRDVSNLKGGFGEWERSGGAVER